MRSPRDIAANVDPSGSASVLVSGVLASTRTSDVTGTSMRATTLINGVGLLAGLTKTRVDMIL